MKPRDGAATAAHRPSLIHNIKTIYLSYLHGVKPPRPLFHFHSVSLFGHFPLLLPIYIHSLFHLAIPSSPLICHSFLSRSHLSPLTSHLSRSFLSPVLISSHAPLLSPPPVDGPGIWELVGPGFYRPDMVETCGGRGASEGYAFPTFGPMLTTVWSSAAWVPGISILPMAFS